MIGQLAKSIGVEQATDNLVDLKRTRSIFGNSKSIKLTDKKLYGVSKPELEAAYRCDPITFNSINKNTQMIMSAGYHFEGFESDTEKKEFMTFIDSIGQVGEDSTFDELLDYVYKSKQIFGYAWIENVYDKNLKNIVDLTRIDPKKMDYARTASGEIVLDLMQKPIGYVQTLPAGASGKGLGDSIPDGPIDNVELYRRRVSLSSNQIFILPFRIALFKLYTLGDGFDSIGLVEAAYKSTIRKINIEEAQSNSIYTRGTYPVVVYVGDEKHQPTPERINQGLEHVKKLKHDRYLSMPYYYKVEPLEVKQSEIVDRTLQYLRENQTGSMGIPLPFATGAGEATNRATLTNQQAILEYTLHDIVNKTVSDFNKYVFKRMAILRNWKSVPRLVWGKIGSEELNEKVARYKVLIDSGIVDPMEVRDLILKSEGITPISNPNLRKNQTNSVSKDYNPSQDPEN